MKKIFFVTAMLCSFFNALAYRIEYGSNVTISQPVHDDLYIAGGTVTINAPIYGDLVIAGGTIVINDSIMNDLLLAGGNVTVNGVVGDDIRCAGGNILFSKNIIGDLVVTGGSVIIDKGVTIGGLLASGGNITIDGNVNGEIKGAFGELYLNGQVAKNIDCRGGKIIINGSVGGKSILAASNIGIGNNAVFNDEVRYWNKNEKPDFKQSLRNVKAIYDPSLRINTGEWYFLGSVTFLGLLWYLGMAFLMILIVQYMLSSTMQKSAETFYSKTLKSLGAGILFFVGIPVAAALAFITVVGVPVGLLLVFGYITVVLLATVITSVIAANWFNNRNNYNWNFWQIVFAALGVFILLKLISLAPFAGFLIIGLLACTSVGSILLNIHWKGKQPKLISNNQHG